MHSERVIPEQKVLDRFWAKVNKTDTCWLWTAGTDWSDYGSFQLTTPYRSIRAHIFSWQLVNGAIPKGMCVCHRCNVTRCVRPEHLVLGTRRYNNGFRNASGRSMNAGGVWSKFINRRRRQPFWVRFWSNVQKTDTCWNWTGYGTNGYGSFRINGRSMQVTRILWTHVNGPIPKGLLVCHHCDNPSCLRLSHLFLGTAKDNVQDCISKGRFRRARGEKQHLSVWTESDVRRMRELYKPGVTSYAQVASLLGAHWVTVRDIVKRRTWKHVH